MTASTNKMAGPVLLSLENELFRTFAFYMAILLFKTIAMSLVTVYYRVTRKVYTLCYCLLIEIYVKRFLHVFNCTYVCAADVLWYVYQGRYNK